jgi:hypothetical protein
VMKIAGEHKAVCAFCKNPKNHVCSNCDEREQTRTEKDLIS